MRSSACARRARRAPMPRRSRSRSEEHTSELQSLRHLVCRLLLEKKKRFLTMPRFAVPSDDLLQERHYVCRKGPDVHFPFYSRSVSRITHVAGCWQDVGESSTVSG